MFANHNSSIFQQNPWKPDDFRSRRVHRFEDAWNFGSSKTLQRLAREELTGNQPQVSIYTGPFGSFKTNAAQIRGMAPCCKRWQINSKGPCGECDGCREPFATGAWRRGDGYMEINCPQFNSETDWGMVSNFLTESRLKYTPRPIIAFDEAHRMSLQIQDKLIKRVEDDGLGRYILITTTLQKEKLGDALVDRATVYQFKHPNILEATIGLQMVAAKYGLKLSTAAARWIANKQNGLPRKCLGDLWAVASHGPELDEATVRNLLDDDDDDSMDTVEE